MAGGEESLDGLELSDEERAKRAPEGEPGDDMERAGEELGSTLRLGELSGEVEAGLASEGLERELEEEDERSFTEKISDWFTEIKASAAVSLGVGAAGEAMGGEKSWWDRLMDGDWKGALSGIWESMSGLFSGIFSGDKPEEMVEVAEGLPECTDSIPPNTTDKDDRWYAGEHPIGNDFETITGRARHIRIIGASLSVHAGEYLRIDDERIPGGMDRRYVRSGRPTQKMLENLETGIEAGHFNNVKAVSILAGGNDVSVRSAEHVTERLGKMIELLRGVNPDVKIVLVSLPPVTGYHPKKKNAAGEYYKDEDDKWVRYSPWKDGEANKRVLEIMEWMRGQDEGSENIQFVDIYTPLKHPDPEKEGYIHPDYNGDGLHLNPQGYELVNGLLVKAFAGIEADPLPGEGGEAFG